MPPPQPPPTAGTSAHTAALEEACRVLLLNDSAVFQLATETLYAILKNIVQHPGEDKYRRIRRGAKAFQEKLSNAKGAVRLLKAAGFLEEGEGTEDATFVLADPRSAPLVEAKAILKAVVKHRFEMDYKAKEEARQQENMAAAQKLAKLKEVSRQNGADAAADAAVERERLLKGLQIDREDRERQKDPWQWK